MSAAFNIYPNNRFVAVQNMYVILCIIGCLVFLSLSVLHVSNRQVLAPLRRLIGVIQQNASAVLGALQIDDGSATAPTDDGGGNTLQLLEETITKLGRLAAHVTNVGDRGSYLLREYMSNDTLDMETRHWIMGARAERLPGIDLFSVGALRPASQRASEAS